MSRALVQSTFGGRFSGLGGLAGQKLYSPVSLGVNSFDGLL